MNAADAALNRLKKSYGATDLDAALLTQLEAAGLVARKVGRGGAVTFALTSAGAARKADVAAAEKRRVSEEKKRLAAAAKAAKAKAKPTLVSLAALVEALAARVAALEGARGPAALPASEVDAKLLDAVREVDLLERHGGLVPLPAVRDAAGLARSDVDAALRRLEGERRVLLKIANDPMTVSRRGDGLEIPGRGLVYYVAIR